jgi:hypothetical protein
LTICSNIFSLTLYYDFDSAKKNSNDDEIFILSEEHIVGIIQGEEDIKNGSFTMEEFEKKYQHYLKD